MSELRRITERYLPEEQIASTPSGSLFRGSDLQTGEKVAIKLIHAADESEARRRRFLEAARGLQSIHSPGFPRLLDFGFTHAGSAFLVTPHLQGSGQEALHALLEAVLRGDPEEPDVVAPEPEPEPPPPAPPSPPPARTAARRSRLSPRVGVPAAVLLLVGTACGLVFLPRWTPEPPRRLRPAAVARPARPPVASKPALPAPAPPPEPEAPPPEPASRIELRVKPSKPRAAPALPKAQEAAPVLPARSDRPAAGKEDQDLENLVTAAGQYETYRRPLEGLRLLASATPDERYAGRFQETRRRLEAQFAQLDRRPPVVLLRAGGTPLYEKGKTGTVPLRIYDDQAVGSVEGWARPEGGGAFVKVAVRHLSGQGYEMEVPPEVHRNGTAELYVVATDLSGHTGQLGSPGSPLKLKRMTWLEKIQGMRERPER